MAVVTNLEDLSQPCFYKFCALGIPINAYYTQFSSCAANGAFQSCGERNKNKGILKRRSETCSNTQYHTFWEVVCTS